jgi:hypothetical protein
MTNNYLRHPSYADYPVVGVKIGFRQLSLVNGEQTDVNARAILEKKVI